MPNRNTCEDFKPGDIVYYVAKHLQPKDGSSPLVKDAVCGKVSSINSRFVFVKYKTRVIKTIMNVRINTWQYTAEATDPNDLWKI